MKILFATSECMPFVKTGGIADVMGALPREILKAGEDVRVILPLYKAISSEWREKMQHMLYFYINLGWRRQYVGIETMVYGGVTYYFVDNEQYFGRDYIYGMGGDEGERFAYFCRAVMEALPKIDFIPDILHCNDWQTGLIPVLHKLQYKHLELFANMRTVYTIHNLQYQGLFPIDTIEDLLYLGNLAYTSDALEFYGMCSCMKGGIVFSDEITTVSPTYSQEIQTAYYGERLDGLLRTRVDHLTGILNGIDTEEYDPEKDPLLTQNYTAATYDKKVENKLALQRELGLTVDANVPMIAMITRLSGQKGLDLVECVLPEIMNTGAQLVILGMGESRYVDLFSWAQWKYPLQVSANFQMNNALAHKIYASADLFLMPSLFEPCGLSQLISLRYGTLPITRETGGLRDTVLAYNEYTGDGNGFTFLYYNAHDMLHVIENAVRMFHEQRDLFNSLAIRAMKGEYGWDQSAKQYIELYEKLNPDAAKKTAPKKKAAPKAKATEEEAKPAEVEAKPAPRKRATKPKAEAAETAEAPAKKTTTRKKAATATEDAPKKPRAPRKKKAETAE